MASSDVSSEQPRMTPALAAPKDPISSLSSAVEKLHEELALIKTTVSQIEEMLWSHDQVMSEVDVRNLISAADFAAFEKPGMVADIQRLKKFSRMD